METPRGRTFHRLAESDMNGRLVVFAAAIVYKDNSCIVGFYALSCGLRRLGRVLCVYREQWCL